MTLREPWEVEQNSRWRGLYDVYDRDGNLVTETKIFGVANAIAAAPELLAALRVVEWIQDDLVLESRRYCPCCDAQERNGHYDSCQLGQALARAEAPGSGEVA